MNYIDFLSPYHKRTERNYIGRVTDTEYPKARAASLAKKWDYEYWDGDRRTGYGGYRYDGRWLVLAKNMAARYKLGAGDRILDVGCGKAFQLYEFTQAVPGIKVEGIDISAYAVEHAKAEIRPFLKVGSASELPYDDNAFDLVFSINTLHNLHTYDLEKALQEIERVGRKHKYICVESYRNEGEKANLMYWQLTCEGFYTPEEWYWWFEATGYSGDYSFIYFE
jgi:protein-L-isoaspartate(D-aspartate) O-methyltransferase